MNVVEKLRYKYIIWILALFILAGSVYVFLDISYYMLKDFTSIEDIGAGAMYHHERFDGNGYPEGLAGEEIPLVARILCVADAVDAMNSKRCYRDRLTPDVILRELRENRGKQFDPDVVDTLLKLIAEGKIKF